MRRLLHWGCGRLCRLRGDHLAVHVARVQVGIVRWQLVCGLELLELLEGLLERNICTRSERKERRWCEGVCCVVLCCAVLSVARNYFAEVAVEVPLGIRTASRRDSSGSVPATGAGSVRAAHRHTSKQRCHIDNTYRLRTSRGTTVSYKNQVEIERIDTAAGKLPAGLHLVSTDNAIRVEAVEFLRSRFRESAAGEAAAANATATASMAVPVVKLQ